MKESEILLNPNKLVRYLKKPASEFTKDDIMCSQVFPPDCLLLAYYNNYNI